MKQSLKTQSMLSIGLIKEMEVNKTEKIPKYEVMNNNRESLLNYLTRSQEIKE